MAKYRKKPVTVDAVQWDGKKEFPSPEWPEWLLEAARTGPFETGHFWVPLVTGPYPSDGRIARVLTLEGPLVVRPGDWIIRGVKGELYPCNPDIFALTYEPVD